MQSPRAESTHLLIIESPEDGVHAEKHTDPEDSLDVGHEPLPEPVLGVVHPVLPLDHCLPLLPDGLPHGLEELGHDVAVGDRDLVAGTTKDEED